MRCAVAKEARRDGNGWRMAGVTGYMLEHQKGVYCVQFKELSRLDTSKITATRGERFKSLIPS